MLSRQVERILRSKKLDHIIVATSTQLEDDPIAELCRAEGFDLFRGSLENVLDRFFSAADSVNADPVMRLTADCPLTDPAVLDTLIEFFQAGEYDYASNTISPSFPDGLDAEIMRFSALKKAWKNSFLPSQFEHVTPYIYNSPEEFKLGSLQNQVDLSHLRWTVDEAVDLAFVREIYACLYHKDPDFRMADILELIGDFPQLSEINSGISRNEGLKNSEAADSTFLTNQSKTYETLS